MVAVRHKYPLFIMALALALRAGAGAAASPPEATCAMGPLKCPDGTYVFPGQGCTFGPCPGQKLQTPDSGGTQKEDSGGSDPGMNEDGQSTEPDDHGNIIIDRDPPKDAGATAPSGNVAPESP